MVFSTAGGESVYICLNKPLEPRESRFLMSVMSEASTCPGCASCQTKSRLAKSVSLGPRPSGVVDPVLRSTSLWLPRGGHWEVGETVRGDVQYFNGYWYMLHRT
jgi:hypothetical protein